MKSTIAVFKDTTHSDTLNTLNTLKEFIGLYAPEVQQLFTWRELKESSNIVLILSDTGKVSSAKEEEVRLEFISLLEALDLSHETTTILKTGT